MHDCIFWQTLQNALQFGSVTTKQVKANIQIETRDSKPKYFTRSHVGHIRCCLPCWIILLMSVVLLECVSHSMVFPSPAEKWIRSVLTPCWCQLVYSVYCLSDTDFSWLINIGKKKKQLVKLVLLLACNQHALCLSFHFKR